MSAFNFIYSLFLWQASDSVRRRDERKWDKKRKSLTVRSSRDFDAMSVWGIFKYCLSIYNHVSTVEIFPFWKQQCIPLWIKSHAIISQGNPLGHLTPLGWSLPLYLSIAIPAGLKTIPRADILCYYSHLLLFLCGFSGELKMHSCSTEILSFYFS